MANILKFTECVDFVGVSCKEFDGYKQYISTGAVKDNKISNVDIEKIEYNTKPSRANLCVNAGDILFAKMQATKKILLIDEELSQKVYSTGFCAVKAKDNILSNECLYYLLSSKFFNDKKDKECAGATQKAINNTGLKKIELKIPAREEQKQIAETLSSITTIIALKQHQLLLLDELVKARFIELFGDPVTNPKNWMVKELSEYVKFLTSGSRGWAKYFSNEGEYFITIKNVKNCSITLDNVQHIIPPDNAEAKRTRVQADDLLISITADLGRTGVVTKEIADHGGYINQHLTCIRLDKENVRPLYVAHYMESDAGKMQFQSKNQNGVKAGLNFNAINSLRFMVPPVTLQDEFVSFVKQVDKSKEICQESIKYYQELLDKKMDEYFNPEEVSNG